MDNLSDSGEAEMQTEILEEHRKVRNLLGTTWNAFFAKFGRLRDIQLKVIPVILQRQNVLVTAPTAGGKTEAVMAPICEILKSERYEGFSCIYVTPTRALVNDLFNRLDSQLGQLGIRLGRKTADHSQLRRPNVLITTPESLESLLTFKREALNHIRIVVIDEIHLLDGTPRGDQLRLLLARLAKYLKWVAVDQPILRIALSATVSDPQRVAAAYLGDDATIVSVSGQRDIDCRIIGPSSGRDEVDATLNGMSKFDDVRKTLVFVNRRKDVDEFTDLFRERMPDHVEVFGHHGSLGVSERERVESGIRRAQSALCVATMTLEIGIDIGDIDLVVCIKPPHSLSGFLQRIGRGCRRRQSATRVLCLAEGRVSEVVFQAYVAQAARQMPKTPIPPLRHSVVVQQVLAYLRQVGNRRRTMNQIEDLFGCKSSPRISSDVMQYIVRDMVGTGLLTFDEGIIGIGQAGNEFINSPKIYSNFSPAPEIAVVDSETGKTVAYVGGVDTSRLKIAGQRYEVNDQQFRGKISVRRTDKADASSPTYNNKGHFGYTSEVGRCIANYCEFEDSELLSLDSRTIFTWIGKLHNTAIANNLKLLGINATPKSFCLQFDGRVDPGETLNVLKNVCSSVADFGVADSLPIEALADCGAHHRCLSEEAQQQSRHDWIDMGFVTDWINRIDRLTPVPESNRFFDDLKLLAEV